MIISGIPVYLANDLGPAMHRFCVLDAIVIICCTCNGYLVDNFALLQMLEKIFMLDR